MENTINSYSVPYRCELVDNTITFYTYKGNRYEENYKQLYEFLTSNYNIQGEVYFSRRPITIRGTENNYIAAVAILKENWLRIYDNNEFQKYCEYALTQRKKINPSNSLNEIDQIFLEAVDKRNKSLVSQNQKLRELANLVGADLSDYSELTIEKVSDEIKKITQFVTINSSLMIQNEKIHCLVVEKAREKISEYNDLACRATIAYTVMQAIKNNTAIKLDKLQNAILIAECKKKYPDFLELDKTRQDAIKREIGSKIAKVPETSVHEYQNAEQVFQFAKKERGKVYVTFGEERSTDINLNILEKNVHNILQSFDSVNDEVSGFIFFWKIVKKLFRDIWNSLISLLNANENLAGSMDIGKNIDNIVENQPLSENARLIHKFNSQNSPLIAVMYDKDISDEKRIEILKTLACTEKFNSNRKNVDISDKTEKYGFGGPPLLHAVHIGNKEIMRIFLENKANPDGQGFFSKIKNIHYEGVTPLHVAAAQNDLEAVKLLVHYGADVNGLNEYGQTPLHAAETPEIIDFLVSNGADVNRKDKEGNTPLHLSAERNGLSTVTALLSKDTIQVDSENHTGNTPLCMAAYFNTANSGFGLYSFLSSEDKSNNLKLLGQLIQSGAKVNHQNHYGYSPIFLAVCVEKKCMGEDHNRVKVNLGLLKKKAELLCQNGADVNILSKDEKFIHRKGSFSFHYNPAPLCTPLQALYSFDTSNPEKRKSVAEVLIQYGAKVDVKKTEGYTLLHQCAKNGDPIGLKYFIEACGLDSNAKAANGETPLNMVYDRQASLFGFREKGKKCLEVLFQNGADPTVTVPHTLTISNNTLNSAGAGIFLKDDAVQMIFENDNNIFSKKAKEKGIDVLAVDADARRKLLKEIYRETAKKEVTVEISMLPEQLGLFSGSYNNLFIPCTEAVEFIKKFREEYNENCQSSPLSRP